MTLMATPNNQQFVSNGSLQGKVFQLLSYYEWWLVARLQGKNLAILSIIPSLFLWQY
jgi:hypothetical protein